MSHISDDSRLRSLVEYHYRRNRHLSSAFDAEDLFQESWIHLHHSEPPPDAAAIADHDQARNGKNGDEPDNPDEASRNEQHLRRAVRVASDRVFGRLRKRVFRGAVTDRTLDFDPAHTVPDMSLVMDLKHLIESLPIDERLVIEMLWSGFQGTEIAEVLELSPQAVTRRKQKAIERLRQRLVES